MNSKCIQNKKVKKCVQGIHSPGIRVMMKLHSSHPRKPWDKELERTIGVGQTRFNLVNSSFFFKVIMQTLMKLE